MSSVLLVSFLSRSSTFYQSSNVHQLGTSVLLLVLVLVLVSGILQVDKVSSFPAKSSLVFMTSYTSRLDDLSRNKESVSRRSLDLLTQSG